MLTIKICLECNFQLFAQNPTNNTLQKLNDDVTYSEHSVNHPDHHVAVIVIDNLPIEMSS